MTDEYNADKDLSGSLEVGYTAIRERMAAGGEPWTPKAPDPFLGLPRGHYGAILADPPWQFDNLWGGRPNKTAAGYPSRWVDNHYETLHHREIASLPVSELAAENCVLMMWVCWPVLDKAFEVIRGWGFKYKTCGFCWVKGHAKQIEMFRDDIDPHMTLGYWTRSNSEVCLLATRGKPKRADSGVKQAIIEPRREHSRKPDCVHERIEPLVAGPYLELFARQSRPGWTTWGKESTKFDRPPVTGT